ncbi:MAG: hypothetical protein H0X29_10385 [Parachlamydiaceae bacterium]|nr:hypothetical protein [Parachlamydiaceae bacterium]
MSSISSAPKALNENDEFVLKRHLIFDSNPPSESMPLGFEKDFENTAVKIASNEMIETYFENKKFETLPRLPERSYLVACTSWNMYGIYRAKHVKQFMSKKDALEIQWKVLTIAEDVFNRLNQDVNKEQRIIYRNIHADEFYHLSEDAKCPKYYKDLNLYIQLRIKPSSYCNLL